jgi:ATP:ADP antiporter, AAA family
METQEMLREVTAARTAPLHGPAALRRTGSGSDQVWRPGGLLRTKLAAVQQFWNQQLPPAERTSAFLLMANLFLVLTAYYVLKTIREALILTEGGAEIKTYSSAVQSALLLIVVPLYSRLAAKMRGFRLILAVTLFFASHLLLFSGAIAAGYHVGVLFYLWLGIFSVVVMTQLWAFASDVYSEAQGLRLFPIIGAGAALGAISGARLAGKVFKTLEVQGTLLLAMAILLASLGLTWLATRRITTLGSSKEAKPRANTSDGFKLILNNRYLLLIAASIVLLNLVNTGGEYVLGKMVVEQSKALGGAVAQQRQFIAAFYSNYLGWAGAIGLTLQLAMSAGALRLVGIRGALLLSPVVALAGYGSIAMLPLLSVAFLAKVIENGADYSVQNTVRHALFLPTSREEKYQAQTAIETFFYRAGDMMTAVLVFGASQFHLAPRYFAAANVAFSLIWLAVSVAIVRAHARALAEQCDSNAADETTLCGELKWQAAPTRPKWALALAYITKSRTAVGIIGLVLLTEPTLLAQAEPTREAEIESQRDAKAAMLAPDEVSKLERLMREFRDQKWFERYSAGYHGLRPKLGGMVASGGFALGPEYTHSFRDGQVELRTMAQISTRGYTKFEGEAGLNKLLGGRSTLSVLASRRNYSGLNYYGPGPDSSREGRADYRLQDTSVDVFGTFEPLRRVKLGASVGKLWVNPGPGGNAALASAETLYPDAQAPGIEQSTTFLRNTVFVQFDNRDNPAGPKSGGNYVFQHSWYRDERLSSYSFQRTDVDLQEFIPLMNKTRRMALRAKGTFTHAEAGQRTPFYLQPVLGGGDDLRGYRFFRFSDSNSIVYNAEYQWEIFSGLDGALFVDAGKVMPHIRLPKFSELETSAGFGLRFNARNATFLRVDVGFSHEGFQVWVKFNDVFNTRRFGTASGQPIY